MKKFLNGLGVFGSVILTIVLTIFIFLYVVILNVKLTIGKNGMTNTFEKIDFVETLKTAENGVMWEDFMQLAENLNLTEEQFEQILNSKDVKGQIGSYVEEVVSTMFSDEKVSITKEEMEDFLNVAVDEYNKVSDTKISDDERQEIINAIDDEMLDNMNDEFGSINLSEEIDSEYIGYIKLVDNLLFGNYTLLMLGIIILIIALIGLCRFSWYKWMPYVKTSAIINAVLLTIIGILVMIIPMKDMEILIPIKNMFATKVFVSVALLILISVGLTLGKKSLVKLLSKKEEPVIINEETKNDIQPEKTKEEKAKKVDKKTVIIIVLLLLIVLLVIFFLLWGNRSYTIRFETNGGTPLVNLEVKNGEVVNLPDSITKEGYIFAGWTNEDGKYLTNAAKVTDDMVVEANWISKDSKVVTAKINIDNDLISDIIFEKNTNLVLPMNPYKKGYVFGGWFDEKDNLLTDNIVLTEDIIIYAKWIKKGAKTSIIKFDTDGGNKIENVVVENGKVVVFPVVPTKEGYSFAGWVDEKGNPITSDTVVKDDMTIKAKWINGYSCPSGCTPVGDGSTCTKTTTKDLVTYSGCPSGTETVETFCSSHQYQVSIGFDEDLTYETAGIICDGNPTGFCVDYNNRYTIPGESCPSGYYKYTEVEGLGAAYGCVKKYDKGGSGCPSGYNKDGNKCSKTETIKCTKN